MPFRDRDQQTLHLTADAEQAQARRFDLLVDTG
jgi:hypothetical protein